MKLAAIIALSSVALTGCWGKAAHRRCVPFIAVYPLAFSESCQFLHMCANEAILSDGERDKLYGIIKAMPDCAEP